MKNLIDQVWAGEMRPVVDIVKNFLENMQKELEQITG